MLSALANQELIDLGHELGLAMTARMSVDELLDLLAGSKRATLDSIVTDEPSRDALEAICEAIGVGAQEWLSLPELVPVHASSPLVSTAAAVPASNDVNDAKVPVDASQGVTES